MVEKKEEIKEYFKSLLDSRKFLIQTILSDININLEYENGSYNVALYSEYGSGKSYFLNSLKEFISDKTLQTGENFDLDTNFKIIEINAWKDDFLDDPILSIGFALKKEIEEDLKDPKCSETDNDKKDNNDVKNKFSKIFNIGKAAAKNALPVIVKGGLNIVIDKTIGSTNYDELKTIVKDISDSVVPTIFENLEAKTEELNKSYLNYNEYLKNIKEALEEYIEKLGGKKLLIIVDELDRCRPDYSVEFLEAINHIFDVKGMVFLFAIDKNALKSAMTTVYGTEMNFDNDLYNLIKPEHEDLIMKIFGKNYKIEDRNKQGSFYMDMYNLFKISAKP